jgi:hypothetical protein
MREELKRLEEEILLDYYEQNHNPMIEVLTEYSPIWAKYIDRKSRIYEGEAIEDGFVFMKLYFNCKIENDSIVEIYKGGTLPSNHLFNTISGDIEMRLMKINEGLISKVQVCKFEFTPKVAVYDENNCLPNISTDKEIRGLMICYRLIKA